MSAYDPGAAAFHDQPISQLLVKVASRCNIDCSYCYWFRDAAVYDKPKLMSAEVLQRLLQRIEEHVVKHSLIDLPIILHGGEPLLWGVENFKHIAEACEAISSRTGCDIPIAVTTNGVLIDDEWLDCFEAHHISVAISLDGPAHIHDLHRRTFQGTGTHAAAERAARMLVSRDIGVSALAVCNPAYQPKQYVDFFAECGVANYDIMIPDATVDESPPSIGSFYKGLFDLWLEANRSKPDGQYPHHQRHDRRPARQQLADRGRGPQACRTLHRHDRRLRGGPRRAADCGRRLHANQVQHFRACDRRGPERAALESRA